MDEDGRGTDDTSAPEDSGDSTDGGVDGKREGRSRPRRVVDALVPGFVAFATLVGGSILTDDDECTGDDGPYGPDLPELGEVQGLEPLSLGEPLWGTGAGGPLDRVAAAAWHGDAVVLLGGAPGQEQATVAVAEAATGAERWHLASGDLLPGAGADGPTMVGPGYRFPGPGDVRTGDGWSVAVGYQQGPAGDSDRPVAREHGVAALDPMDGTVLWQAPLSGAGPLERFAVEPVVTHLVTGDDVVLAAIDPPGPTGRGEEWGPVHSVALDPADGSVLWEIEGLVPVGAAAGVAIMESEDPRDVVLLAAATGEIIFDLRDGSVVPDLGEGPIDSELLEIAGDVVVLALHDTDDSVFDYGAVLDLGSSDPIVELGRGTIGCESSPTMIACTMVAEGPDRVATVPLEDGDVGGAALAAGDLEGETLAGVVDGRLLTVRDGDHARSRSFDRGGQLVDEDLPGYLVDAGEGYALFADIGSDDPWPGAYTVHELDAPA